MPTLRKPSRKWRYDSILGQNLLNPKEPEEKCKEIREAYEILSDPQKWASTTGMVIPLSRRSRRDLNGHRLRVCCWGIHVWAWQSNLPGILQELWFRWDDFGFFLQGMRRGAPREERGDERERNDHLEILSQCLVGPFGGFFDSGFGDMGGFPSFGGGGRTSVFSSNFSSNIGGAATFQSPWARQRIYCKLLRSFGQIFKDSVFRNGKQVTVTKIIDWNAWRLN